MAKRGQLAIFILIGIALIVGFGIFLYIRSELIPKEEFVPPSAAPVKIFVEECMKKTTENALLLVGVQGGYIYFDGVESFETFYSETAYWYDNGISKMPSKAFIEWQISKYVTEEINLRCLNDLESLKEQATIGEGEANVTITDDKVIVEMIMPVEIIHEDKIDRISQFKTEVPVRLGMALDVGEKIVEMQLNDSEWVDLSYLAELELENSHFNYGNVTLYSVVDYESEVIDMPFRLIFANRFV